LAATVPSTRRRSELNPVERCERRWKVVTKSPGDEEDQKAEGNLHGDERVHDPATGSAGRHPPFSSLLGLIAEARSAGKTPKKTGDEECEGPMPKPKTRQSAGRMRRAGLSGGLMRLTTKGADHAAKKAANKGCKRRRPRRFR